MAPAAGPLLAVDAPSLLYRAFFALPDSIKGPDGRPRNALLGCANLLLQAHERFGPRATVLCFGEEAAHYRVELFEGYHADRPPMPDDLEHQWRMAREFFEAFGFLVHRHDELEADDLLGAYARVETEAGGTAMLFTGDRDMFQCVSASVRVLWPGGKEGPQPIDVAGVRARYGIEPSQVPDFIALRGDPSDGIPGAKGIGEKTARDLLSEHGSLDALLELPISLKPRVRGTLETQRDELLAFRRMATLQPVDVERPADAPLDAQRAAAMAEEHGMARLASRLTGLR
ncbi:5'-3' exonuclease [Conexibacter sp. SYSU D00693]|uniref:5'-3' exonuclease n=1 Tax=Conexibacter sp. SYSU D00693 TaxID=2812560 RepID=UPI00196AE3D4|nr:5'-3' exonuclease [Conexibacter sp. SYSU D00693]